MMRPQIQNDFATYRRHLSRLKREQEAGLLSELPVADTDANAISMFIAEVRAVSRRCTLARCGRIICWPVIVIVWLTPCLTCPHSFKVRLDVATALRGVS